MEYRPLMMVIKHTSREWNNYMRKLALEAGIPDSYRMVVMFLLRNPGVSQKELSDFCQRTPAAISQTIKEMQYTGYIRKETDEQDQRYAKLYLTEKGEQSAVRVREKLHAADRVITSAITKEKEDEMVALLERLTETIQKEL